MKLTSRGWQRDHGTSTLTKFDARHPILEDDVTHFEFKKLYFDSDVFEDGHFHTLGFGVTNVRLGGDYYMKIHISDEELIAIFLKAFKGRKTDRLFALIAELYKAE